ncbi:glycosyltransferase family 4 protein [bacterium]|nr:glycosyltransferase family 4 protein [bacterium]
MKKLKIAQLAPVEETVPPRKYGGTELVVSNLTEELVGMGHEVHLLASGDSKTSGKLVKLVPKAIRVMTKDVGQEKLRESWKYVSLSEAFKYLLNNKFDIIHQHVGWRVSPFEKSFNVPFVTTCHGPLNEEYVKMVFDSNKNNNYISISDNQRKDNRNLNFISTVYNGIDVNLFKYSEKADKEYYAFLGRMSYEKGPKEAILAAKKAGVKLKMAAKIDASDMPYFKKEVEPLINNKDIEYIGEIGPKEKDKFLGNAKALLAPINWEEPFGLYFVESMATGTPVISVKRGSAPEIIKNNVTGYLVDKKDTVGLIAKKIRIIESMDSLSYIKMRKASRDNVVDNFSIKSMSNSYLAAYTKAIAGYKKKK